MCHGGPWIYCSTTVIIVLLISISTSVRPCVARWSVQFQWPSRRLRSSFAASSPVGQQFVRLYFATASYAQMTAVVVNGCALSLKPASHSDCRVLHWFLKCFHQQIQHTANVKKTQKQQGGRCHCSFSDWMKQEQTVYIVNSLLYSGLFANETVNSRLGAFQFYFTIKCNYVCQMLFCVRTYELIRAFSRQVTWKKFFNWDDTDSTIHLQIVCDFFY